MEAFRLALKEKLIDREIHAHLAESMANYADKRYILGDNQPVSTWLHGAFEFSRTEEGHSYWWCIYESLRKEGM